MPAKDASRPPLRVACMVSGRGRTVMNLVDRIDRGELPIEIVLVAATKPGVAAIDAAAQRGLPTLVIAAEETPSADVAPRTKAGSGDGSAPRTNTGAVGAGPSRTGARGRARMPLTAAIDDALDRALVAAAPDLICLCGYLRLFRVGRWAGRVVNLHPGPLPDFGGKGMYGERVHRAVLDAGLGETRCCVHLVDDEYDHGSVIADRRVMVLPADTPESLAIRVRRAEEELLPDVLRRIASGEIELPISGASFHRPDLSSKA